MGPQDRFSGTGFKPPCAAVTKSCGSEQQGKGFKYVCFSHLLLSAFCQAL